MPKIFPPSYSSSVNSAKLLLHPLGSLKSFLTVVGRKNYWVNLIYSSTVWAVTATACITLVCPWSKGCGSCTVEAVTKGTQSGAELPLLVLQASM